MTEGRTLFRKYVATGVAAITIGAALYAFLIGIIDTAAEGTVAGIIIGMAAKYLWEEQGQ